MFLVASVMEEKKTPDLDIESRSADEAEALAWDAYRMAEEARRAAERLAELKASLSLRNSSKSREQALKVVYEKPVVEARELEDQTRPAGAALDAPKEETAEVAFAEQLGAPPAQERTPPTQERTPPAPEVERTKATPNDEAIPAQTEAAKPVAVAPAVQVTSLVTKVTSPVTTAVKAKPAPQASLVSDEPETDLFVRMLDAMGVDRLCGVNEMMQDVVLNNEKAVQEMKQKAALAKVFTHPSKAVEPVVTPKTEVTQPIAPATTVLAQTVAPIATPKTEVTQPDAPAMTDAKQTAAPATTVLAQTCPPIVTPNTEVTQPDAPAMTVLAQTVAPIVTPKTEATQPAAPAMADAEQTAAPAMTIVAQASTELAQNDKPLSPRAAPVDPPSCITEAKKDAPTTDAVAQVASAATADDDAAQTEVAEPEASTSQPQERALSPRQHKAPRELNYPDPFGGDHDDMGNFCGAW